MKEIIIKEETKVGNVMLEEGDKVRVVESWSPRTLKEVERTFSNVEQMDWNTIKIMIARNGYKDDNKVPKAMYHDKIAITCWDNKLKFSLPCLWDDTDDVGREFYSDVDIYYNFDSGMFSADYAGVGYDRLN